jgi:hypothetical protein
METYDERPLHSSWRHRLLCRSPRLLAQPAVQSVFYARLLSALVRLHIILGARFTYLISNALENIAFDKLRT